MRNSVMVCPAYSEYDASQFWAGQGAQTGYGINNYPHDIEADGLNWWDMYDNTQGLFSDNTQFWGWPIDKIGTKSNRAMFGDIWRDGRWTYNPRFEIDPNSNVGWDPTISDTLTTVDYVHRDKCEVSFYDGHVDTLKANATVRAWYTVAAPSLF